MERPAGPARAGRRTPSDRRRWPTARAQGVDGDGFDAQAAHAAHGAELCRFALRQRRRRRRPGRRPGGAPPGLAGGRRLRPAAVEPAHLAVRDARNVVVDEARRFAVRPWQRTLPDGPRTDVPGVGASTRRSSTHGSWRRRCAGSARTTGRRSCGPTCAAGRGARHPRGHAAQPGVLRDAGTTAGDGGDGGGTVSGPGEHRASPNSWAGTPSAAALTRVTDPRSIRTSSSRGAGRSAIRSREPRRSVRPRGRWG